MTKAQEHLELATKHLEKVQAAWDDPVDWSDLLLYGFYCLENAVVAVSEARGDSVPPSHPAKVEAARKAAREEGLPDVSGLLEKLNRGRKAVAYGDMKAPEFDPEDLAISIEEYVSAVDELLSGS